MTWNVSLLSQSVSNKTNPQPNVLSCVLYVLCVLCVLCVLNARIRARVMFFFYPLSDTTPYASSVCSRSPGSFIPVVDRALVRAGLLAGCRPMVCRVLLLACFPTHTISLILFRLDYPRGLPAGKHRSHRPRLFQARDARVGPLPEAERPDSGRSMPHGKRLYPSPRNLGKHIWRPAMIESVVLRAGDSRGTCHASSTEFVVRRNSQQR